MPLTSTITHYDATWPHWYQDEVSRLTPLFGVVMTAIHHVGSTAVPGLAAKPEIDMLIVVSSLSPVASWTDALMALGYRRGGDLSDGHLFYKRDVHGVRTHKLHVCLEGHVSIEELLRFRDMLRANDVLRYEYQALKLELERSNTAGISEYLSGKEPFIRTALERSGGTDGSTNTEHHA